MNVFRTQKRLIFRGFPCKTAGTGHRRKRKFWLKTCENGFFEGHHHMQTVSRQKLWWAAGRGLNCRRRGDEPFEPALLTSCPTKVSERRVIRASNQRVFRNNIIFGARVTRPSDTRPSDKGIFWEDQGRRYGVPSTTILRECSVGLAASRMAAAVCSSGNRWVMSGRTSSRREKTSRATSACNVKSDE